MEHNIYSLPLRFEPQKNKKSFNLPKIIKDGHSCFVEHHDIGKDNHPQVNDFVLVWESGKLNEGYKYLFQIEKTDVDENMEVGYNEDDYYVDQTSEDSDNRSKPHK